MPADTDPSAPPVPASTAARAAPAESPAARSPATAPAATPAQPRNPLHGLTLEAIIEALVAAYGWDGLGERIPVRCFLSEPSVKSSLKFLRKTPWAREKVESLYLYLQRDLKRGGALR